MRSQKDVNYAVLELDETALRTDHLLGLCRGDTLAIRIRGFASPSVIRCAEQHLLAHPERGALGHAWQHHGCNIVSFNENLHIAFRTLPEFARHLFE